MSGLVRSTLCRLVVSLERATSEAVTAEQREGMSNLSGVPAHYNPAPLIGQQYQAAPAGAAPPPVQQQPPPQYQPAPYQQQQQQLQTAYQQHQQQQQPPYQPQQQPSPQYMGAPAPTMPPAGGAPGQGTDDQHGGAGRADYAAVANPAAAALNIPIAEAHPIPFDNSSHPGAYSPQPPDKSPQMSPQVSSPPQPQQVQPAPPPPAPAAPPANSNNLSMQSLEARMAALRGGK